MVLGKGNKPKEQAQQGENAKGGGHASCSSSSSHHEQDNENQSNQDDDKGEDDASSSSNDKEGFLSKMKRKTVNAGHASKLSAYKKKKQAQNQMLKSKLLARKEKFGTDYLTLIMEQQQQQKQQQQKQQSGDTKALQALEDQALADIQELQAQIDKNLQKMQDRQQAIHEKIILDNGEHKTTTAERVTAQKTTAATTQQKPFWKFNGNKKKKPTGRNPNAEYYPEPQGLAG